MGPRHPHFTSVTIVYPSGTMATEMFSISSNTFGFIMGGITLLGLLISMARFHLPSNKIKVLESLLDETETFFKKAIEDGLLIEPHFVRETEQRLEILKRRTCSLQSRAYSATTLRKDYAEFFRGTSTSIARACRSLKQLRAVVITSSEEGRQRLMEENSAPPPSIPLNSVPQVENHPTFSSADEIVRPRSCPLPARNSAHSRNVAPSDNPFSDPTHICVEVQTEYTSVNLEHVV